MRIDQSSSPASSPLNSLLSRAFNPVAGQGNAGKLQTAQQPVAAPSSQVAISDAGRNLAQQAGDASEKILGDLTRKSLSALGITSKDLAAGAKIEFDSLTYSATSSTSLSASRSLYQSGNARRESGSLQYHSEQSTQITGSGRITTADGRQFAFESALQVTSVLDVQRSVSSEASGDASNGESNGEDIFAQFPDLQFSAPPRANQGGGKDDLLKIIDDILQQIRDNASTDGAANILGQIGNLPGADAANQTEGKAAAATPSTNPGIAVGEPDPSRAGNASGARLLNLSQVQDAAARLAKQLEQFSEQVQPRTSLAIAA